MDGEEGCRQRRSSHRQPEAAAAQPRQEGADQGVEAHVHHVIAPRVQTAYQEIPPATNPIAI